MSRMDVLKISYRFSRCIQNTHQITSNTERLLTSTLFASRTTTPQLKDYRHLAPFARLFSVGVEGSKTAPKVSKVSKVEDAETRSEEVSLEEAENLTVTEGQADDGALLPISRTYMICATVALTYIGYFMFPVVGAGSLNSAVLLAKKAKSPLMQRTAASRIYMMAQSEGSVAQMINLGAVEALVGLILQPECDKEVMHNSLDALGALASFGCGKEALAHPSVHSALCQATQASQEDGPAREKLLKLTGGYDIKASSKLALQE
mmetsp:Transcript_35991/g.49970  ORF Transcript_35991/g.49970 Transcript_35991/m.49970 type:complete len:263 (+) Transcript_35991:129-917(+)|eukprot:CAMPEP_0196592302 /NCGR_PEP_ID=MMETSP1081-20130531/72345_1 /TAXON_ID=36882 /ORGANISM="Pyramimonas amylifera, Strain CCMP720" /LENGTH=262 /DNA_ID=CAMNT_0041915935 /DNA_START=122 /DNA_END=910 /DNA_ORIENTATION=-